MDVLNLFFKSDYKFRFDKVRIAITDEKEWPLSRTTNENRKIKFWKVST
jgi:hypothetical protein